MSAPLGSDATEIRPDDIAVCTSAVFRLGALAVLADAGVIGAEALFASD
jgi:hypothetical protein